MQRPMRILCALFAGRTFLSVHRFHGGDGQDCPSYGRRHTECVCRGRRIKSARSSAGCGAVSRAGEEWLPARPPYRRPSRRRTLGIRPEVWHRSRSGGIVVACFAEVVASVVRSNCIHLSCMESTSMRFLEGRLCLMPRVRDSTSRAPLEWIGLPRCSERNGLGSRNTPCRVRGAAAGRPRRRGE